MKKQIILSALFVALLVLAGVQKPHAQTVSQGYYVGINGQAAGPYSINELRGLIQNGTLTRASLVWREGMANWAEASTVPEISALFASSPPPLPSTPPALLQTQANGPVNWTAVADSTFGDSWIMAIAWGNNRWVAVGANGKMAYSTDGKSWTAVVDSTFGDYSSITAIAWGNNRFVAVGNDGKIVYSADGIRWTAVVDSTFGDFSIWVIAYGNNRFVAVGGGGKMAYSVDGERWTSVENSTDYSFIEAVAWGNNRWVAVGDSGEIVYSTDGVRWTAVTNSTFPRNYWLDEYNENNIYHINAVVYGNGRFVAVGDDGRMAYSADGINWTAVVDSTFGNSFIEAVAWGNNRFVAGGSSGKMAYSTDGVRWTAVVDSTFGDNFIFDIAWGNNRWVAGGWDGKMAYCDW